MMLTAEGLLAVTVALPGTVYTTRVGLLCAAVVIGLEVTCLDGECWPGELRGVRGIQSGGELLATFAGWTACDSCNALVVLCCLTGATLSCLSRFTGEGLTMATVGCVVAEEEDKEEEVALSTGLEGAGFA